MFEVGKEYYIEKGAGKGRIIYHIPETKNNEKLLKDLEQNFGIGGKFIPSKNYTEIYATNLTNGNLNKKMTLAGGTKVNAIHEHGGATILIDDNFGRYEFSCSKNIVRSCLLGAALTENNDFNLPVSCLESAEFVILKSYRNEITYVQCSETDNKKYDEVLYVATKGDKEGKKERIYLTDDIIGEEIYSLDPISFPTFKQYKEGKFFGILAVPEPVLGRNYFHACAVVAYGSDQSILVTERNAYSTEMQEGHKGNKLWLMNAYKNINEFAAADFNWTIKRYPILVDEERLRILVKKMKWKTMP